MKPICNLLTDLSSLQAPFSILRDSAATLLSLLSWLILRGSLEIVISTLWRGPQEIHLDNIHLGRVGGQLGAPFGTYEQAAFFRSAPEFGRGPWKATRRAGKALIMLLS
jgi:hypothetical protein